MKTLEMYDPKQLEELTELLAEMSRDADVAIECIRVHEDINNAAFRIGRLAGNHSHLMRKINEIFYYNQSADTEVNADG